MGTAWGVAGSPDPYSALLCSVASHEDPRRVEEPQRCSPSDSRATCRAPASPACVGSTRLCLSGSVLWFTLCWVHGAAHCVHLGLEHYLCVAQESSNHSLPGNLLPSFTTQNADQLLWGAVLNLARYFPSCPRRHYTHVHTYLSLTAQSILLKCLLSQNNIQLTKKFKQGRVYEAKAPLCPLSSRLLRPHPVSCEVSTLDSLEALRRQAYGCNE